MNNIEEKRENLTYVGDKFDNSQQSVAISQGYQSTYEKLALRDENNVNDEHRQPNASYGLFV